MDNNGIKSIAEAMLKWGDPRLQAEADQFRTNREISDFKLAQAKRDAENEAARKAHVDWLNLHMMGRKGAPKEVEPISGDVVSDEVTEIPKLFARDPKTNVLRLDPARADEFYARLVAAYGPDALTKFHEFVSNASSDWGTRMTPMQQGAFSTGGVKNFNAVTGNPVNDITEGQRQNVFKKTTDNIFAQAQGNAEATAEFGSGPDPEAPGQVIYGRRYPWLPKSMKPAGSEPPAPSSEKSANPLAELIATPGASSSSSSEPPVPSPSPSAATTEEAKAPEDESSDPLKDQSVASILTKAVKAQVDASNKAIKAQVDSAVKNPKGRLVPIPGGGAKWVPDKIEVPDMVVPEKTALTPDELEKLSRLENPFIPRSFTEAEKKRTSDDSWKANLKQMFIDELSPEGDTQLSDQHAIALASEADNLRLKLETRAFPPESARAIAVSAVKEAFNGNYELIYQIYGKAHVVDKNEKRGLTHWDRDQLSPAEMISGAKEIKHTDGIRPSSVGKFRASIDQALDQYPIQGDPKYQKQGMDLVKTFRDYGTSTPPADVMKLASDIKFWEDIVANASNGYAAESASGRGFTQRKPSADEIEMIRRKIEAGKAKLKLKTQSN